MSSPESRESKVVQTELAAEEYDRLRRLADQEGCSIKASLRWAVTEYVRRHLRHDPADPLFDVDAGTGERPTDARSTDEYVAEAVDEDRG